MKTFIRITSSRELPKRGSKIEYEYEDGQLYIGTRKSVPYGKSLLVEVEDGEREKDRPIRIIQFVS